MIFINGKKSLQKYYIKNSNAYVLKDNAVINVDFPIGKSIIAKDHMIFSERDLSVTGTIEAYSLYSKGDIIADGIYAVSDIKSENGIYVNKYVQYERRLIYSTIPS